MNRPDPYHVQAPAPSLEADPGSAPYRKPAERIREAHRAVLELAAALLAAGVVVEMGSAVGVS